MSKNQRHYQTDSEEEQIWTTVYSDMVTNMMLFFLMLYGLTRLAGDVREQIMKGMEEKFRGKTEVEVRAEKVMKDFREEEAVNKVTSLMEEQGLDKYTSVAVDEEQIRISMNIPVLFASGDSAITDSAKAALNGVAKILKSVPNKVIIEGHTDNIPITVGKYASNWELSVARAYSVIEYFVSDRELDPKRFIAAGFGEYRPLGDNSTPEGRAKNRRIELVMVR